MKIDSYTKPDKSFLNNSTKEADEHNHSVTKRRAEEQNIDVKTQEWNMVGTRRRC